MTKKTAESQHKMIVFEVDPSECPFREFRDNELAVEFWGLGPAAFRATVIALMNKSATKPSADYIWVDEQTQPLPRSVRQYLHGWIRAEELAMSRWEAEVVIFEENNGGKINIIDTQLSHAQVLLRSSFCRRVLSACFMLERAEGLTTPMYLTEKENFVRKPACTDGCVKFTNAQRISVEDYGLIPLLIGEIRAPMVETNMD